MRRNTKEREIVYNIIDEFGHASTKQIIEALKKEDISLATIYRNLTILLEEEKN
ncbi:MAG: transcriptional repressor [Clostridium sp.]|nr:MAG: transcriptional repressor [Clostridium sp.]